MPEDTKLLLVGCGKMGSAILCRVLAAGLIGRAVIVEPSHAPNFIKDYPQIEWQTSVALMKGDFMPDIVLFAIKPQSVAEAVPSYACFHASLFVSIMAGVTLARLQTLLQNPKTAIVRAMPNLPASIGEGVSVSVANAYVTTTQRALCDKLLGSVGDSAWVEDESLIDAVTALSGSGPAYVFALCEAMADAGQKLGLAPDLAARLARKTLIGSGALLAQSTESASNLRRAVTSRGGTTEAALRVLLKDDALHDLMVRTMTEATKRAKELAQ